MVILASVGRIMFTRVSSVSCLCGVNINNPTSLMLLAVKFYFFSRGQILKCFVQIMRNQQEI